MARTFVGGKQVLTTEVTTPISVAGQFETLLGTWSTSDLQHFDSPANGQLRHIGNNPREYKIQSDLTIEWTANDEIDVKIVKWDNSESMFVDIFIQIRQVNNIVGGRDVAFYTILSNVILDKNDYIYLEVANIDGTGDVTLELDWFLQLETRG